MPVHTGIIMITGKYKMGVNRPSICQGDPETAWHAVRCWTGVVSQKKPVAPRIEIW